MTATLIAGLIIASRTSLADPTPSPSAQPRVLASFNTPADIAAWQPADAKTSAVTIPGANGAKAMQVDFQPADYPKVSLRPAQPWDWTGETLVVDGGVAWTRHNFQ